MNSSTSKGVSGARPHVEILKAIPVDRKILLFMLCIELMECYIMNSIGSLTTRILYVYKHRLINDVWSLQ
jgi:hypothetical protein